MRDAVAQDDRAAGVQPVLLPCSVYALGSSRYPAAREMIDAGLAVVLATDFNPGSSPTTSMQMALSLASTHMRMTPAEAITAATVNAAYSLNRGASVGGSWDASAKLRVDADLRSERRRYEGSPDQTAPRHIHKLPQRCSTIRIARRT